MILDALDEAVAAGARLERACETLGLTARTVQRWRQQGGGEDRRCGPSSAPHNKLSDAERQRIVTLATSAEFCDLSPRQLVPRLADRGEYIASESTVYRVLHQHDLQHHRARTRPPTKRPRALTATGPGQVYSWDITYLPSPVRGQYFYLYMFVDIWSRRIVAKAVHDCECGEHAARLVESICNSQTRSNTITWLHSDNGAPMKSATLLATLRDLRISTSFSRPRVSNDNPYSESLFRTLKYRPSYPAEPFKSLADATAWVERFVEWYNNEHLHSSINFVTPNDRHFGHHTAILAKRHRVYNAAKRRHPERWTGSTRNWNPVRSVCLNPERTSGTTQSTVRHP